MAQSLPAAIRGRRRFGAGAFLRLWRRTLVESLYLLTAPVTAAAGLLLVLAGLCAGTVGLLLPGRSPVVAGALAPRARTLAIRQRSKSADHRAGARTPAAAGDPPGNSKPIIPAHRPPSISSRPAAAVTGAVSRYSDSTSVRRPRRKTNLAPGRHQLRTAKGNTSVMAPA